METERTPSDGPTSPSPETSGTRRVSKRPYQRKVKLALSRHQAAVVRDLMLTLASGGAVDPDALTGDQRRVCKVAYRAFESSIDRRDRAQRMKEYKSLPPEPILVTEDVPFQEMES